MGKKIMENIIKLRKIKIKVFKIKNKNKDKNNANNYQRLSI